MSDEYRGVNRSPKSLPKKRSLILRLLAVVLGCLLLAVLFLPTVLGSRWIYEPLIHRLEAGNFQLSVGTVQLRWLTPSILRDISITEANRPVMLRIGEVRTDRGLLWSLLSGRRLGRIEIIDPQFDIELLKDSSNLMRLIDSFEGKLVDSASPAQVLQKAIAIDLDVMVKGLTVRVEQHERGEPLIAIPPIDVSIVYRAADGSSKLHIEPTQLLKEVAVTPELMQLGLGYAIPLLAKSAWFDGRISIATGPIDVLLDSPNQSTGTAIITLHEVRSGPSEPALIQILDLVAKMRGQPTHHELVFIDGSQIDVRVADQRVSHRGLQLGLPRIDPRLQLSSAGSVGLEDRSLDLIVDLPIPIEQLARRDDVKDLGVPTLKLPIRGSLDEPRVDWEALRGEGADLLGIIRERIIEEAPGTAAILEGLEGLADGKADQAIGAAMDLLREVRKARQSKKDPNSTEPDILPESSSAPEPQSNRPILDALKNLFRDREGQK